MLAHAAPQGVEVIGGEERPRGILLRLVSVDGTPLRLRHDGVVAYADGAVEKSLHISHRGIARTALWAW